MAKYPQLLQPLQEMVQLVLAVRPDNVFQFVNDSFRSYKMLFSKASQENKRRVLSHIARNDYEEPEPQDRAFQLLRTYRLDK
ncbi:hypothetical protein RvY_01789 [Ramazzottius varieornatus]|uniref:Uncharacterized protein n=1 Tax=Ramazzottius varieornatus TaxID=947166 RepID=A0A1D1UNJ3_RAMVA|nr:hypothetical protein RvY_01789 [Ramazzottius varieornatus]